MRHQYESGTNAIIILVPHEAADRIEEAPQLALGVMEAPGARPAIRAGENRPIARLALHAAKLVRDQIERFIPGNLDERLGAAPLPEGAGTLLEPALAHGGTAPPPARHPLGQAVQAQRGKRPGRAE